MADAINLGTSLGEWRETGRQFLILSPTGGLANHHYFQSDENGPGYKKGDWLIGERVTEATATHIGVHGFKVESANCG